MESKDVVTFRQNDLPWTSFSAFEDMRKKGQLCDVTITVQHHSISAHRVILAAVIPYFQVVFTSNGVATEENEFAVGDLDPRALESLIVFAYSGIVKISTENVLSLLVASHFLRLAKVQDACVEFLSKRLRVANVVEVTATAHRLNNSNLIGCSNRYIRNNFEDVSKDGSFSNLPYACLKELISEDDVNVRREEVVLEAVMTWVKFAPSERYVVLPELLSEVRMIYLPADYLMKLAASEELIRTSIPCRDLVDEVKNYHLAKDISVFSNLKTAPRKRRGLREGIYALCRSTTGLSTVQYYDFLSATWHGLIAHEQNGIVYHAVLVKEKIYMFLAETVQICHLKTLKWEIWGRKHRGIGGAAVVPHGNVIYCFGGSCSTHKVLRFDTETNKFLKEGTMKTPRYDSAAASLREYIFVTGGCGPGGDLNIVEKYVPSTGQWCGTAPMLTVRCRHRCTAMNGKIYVCGSYTGSGISRTAEVYDPPTNQWCSISPMKTARFFFPLVPYSGKIYALGGLGHSLHHILEVESYDPVSEKWGESGFHVPDGFLYAVSIF